MSRLAGVIILCAVGCWQYVVIADEVRRQLGELSLGQVVKARVTSVSDDGVLCTLPGGVRALVTTDHMPGIYQSYIRVTSELLEWLK